jgi:hypothetical protein
VNGRRVSVSLPGADAGVLTRAARFADGNNIDIWLGDLSSSSANHDDCYVTTTAAAVAAVTDHCRIGIFLSLRGSGTPLRLAEDVGVVDQASGGRLELGLVVPATDRDDWERNAQALLSSWHYWPIDDDRSVAAMPGPAQPWLPRVVVDIGDGDGVDEAERLGAGVLRLDGATCREVDWRARRIALAVDVAGPVRDWLASDVLGAMVDLRIRADDAHARDVVINLTGWELARLEDDLRLLGVVVGTSLRCPDHKVEFLALDTWRWLHELNHLHQEIPNTRGDA